MKFSAIKWCALIGLTGLIVSAAHSRDPSVATKKNKVMIYPSAGETIGQLRQQGITNVDNYGSYWIAEADDKQFRALQATHGDRAVAANYLNHIELRAVAIDTTVGEPAVPAEMRQGATAGKRLRLIQFKGPVKPNWLDQTRAAGDVKVISYIPNNAYIVWVDSNAEQKLAGLVDSRGPIQWIGAYHPYYKIPQDLLSPSGSELIKVRVAVVDQSQEPQAASGVRTLGSVQTSLTRNGQEIMEMEVSPSAIAPMAQLPDVLWIEKVWPKRILDEVQDLVLFEQTNFAGFSPTPRNIGGTNYLAFLINTVGGGLSSFLDPTTYPVVDIADTGLDNGDPNGFTAHPAFHVVGNGNLSSRVVYMMPRWLAGDPLTQLGCTTRIVQGDQGDFRFREAADLDGHGTAVASILAGYDAGTNINGKATLELLSPVTNTVTVTITCANITNGNFTAVLTNGFTNACSPQTVTNVVFTQLSTNACPYTTNAAIAFTGFTTNFYFETRVDGNGFQFGMGVSPFGLIGINRVWGTMESSSFSLDTINNVCTPVFHDSSLCMNDLVALMAMAYSANAGKTLGARIQNNSWADTIDIHGSNGGVYALDSQTYDIGVRDALLPPPNSVSALNQEFVVVFACNTALGDAGSSGGGGGFADMRVTAPATAKNVISVGSSINPRPGSACWPPPTQPDQTNSLDMAGFSAPGPTVDGRFKPEIVAPGSSVYAAWNQLQPSLEYRASGLTPTNCETKNLLALTPDIINSVFPCGNSQILYRALYNCNNGSSFAAPAVSGGIQLLWWYFEHRLTNEVGRALSQPSPAMAKAYLCNSARYLPVTNPQTGAMDTLPSILQGMGEMDLERMFDGVARVIRDESTPRAIDVPLIATNRAPQQTYFSQSGQSYEVSGEVQSNGLPFRVTLAWVDAPGDPAALKQLVNDLDLSVTIGGQTYKGNVFSEDHSVTGGGFDSLNNMESVFVPAGQTGAWSVVVQAADIAGNGVPNVGRGFGQDFALVVYNAAVTNRSDVPNLSTNNSCQTALEIGPFPFTFTNGLNKITYSNVHPSPTAGRGGVDEFFKIENPTPGTVFTVDTFGSSFDTVLSVWEVSTDPRTVLVRGECGALAEVTSDDNAASGFQSQVSFTADGSNAYYIVVEPHYPSEGGTNMVLHVQASNSSISVTPASLTFGDQISGTTSAVQTVTYHNGATVPVQITGTSITGSNLTDFAILSQNCLGSTLSTGISCTVEVGFTPTGVGLRQANLVFTDDATGSPRTIPLQGTGTPAVPLVCLSTNALVFSNQLVGTTSAAQSITLTNCGSADLAVSNVSITGSASSDFSVAQTCTNGPISGGGTCTLNVTFTPLVAGTRQANLAIAHDASGSPTTVSLKGTGATAAPAVCFSRNSVSFGSIGVGSTSAVQSVTITNCGTAALVISNVTVTGANAGDFMITSTNCTTVGTGATCQVSLRFAPSVGGSRSANLSVTDNASGSPQLLPLSGSGSLSQPDAAVGKNTKLKKMVGMGVINTSGVGQEIIQKVRRGARRGVRFYVALQNVGSGNDHFLAQGDANSGGFTVNYFLGAKPADSVDVSAAVRAATFSTATLGPGAVTGDSTVIRVEVFADKLLVAKGTTKTFTLTFSSASDPAAQDAVRVTVTAR